MTNVEFIARQMVHEETTLHPVGKLFVLKCVGVGLGVVVVLALLLIQTFLTATVH